MRAGGWAMGGHVLGQAIRLASNLLMTRLLVPEAFGLMAIVIVLMIGFALFSDIGVSQNIIRSPRGEDPVFLNTAWTLQILRGLAIWVLATLSAAALPLAHHFGWMKPGTVYADPLLPWVISVYSLTAVIQGFGSTKLAVARRRMRMRPITENAIASQLVALVVTVAAAWWTHSIWALVAGSLVSSVSGCLLGHWLLPGPRDRLAWDKEALRELLGFGKWVFLSSIVGFLVINGDRLLLGGLIEAPLLGVYTIAFLLVNSIQMVMALGSASIVFPALSEVLRERPQDLAATTNKFQRLGDLFLMPASGFLIVAGPSVVALLYDTRYQAAGGMLSALAIGAIGLRYQVVEQCYLSMGKPQINTVTNVFRLLVLYVGVPVGFHYWQFAGALAAIVLSQYAGWPAAIHFKIKHSLMNMRTEVFAVPALALGLLLGLGFAYIAPTRQALRSFF